METSRINTAHPAFIGSRTAVSGLISEVKRDIQGRKLPSEASVVQDSTAHLTPSASTQSLPVTSQAPGAALLPPPVPPPPTGSNTAAQSPQVIMRQPSAPRKPQLGSAPPPPPSIRKPKIGPSVHDEPFSEQDAIETEVIRRLLTSYFDIVKIKILDSIPKAVTLKLVSRVREELHDSLVGDLYKDDQIDALLDENAEVAGRRKRLREVIALLEVTQQAIAAIQSSFHG